MKLGYLNFYLRWGTQELTVSLRSFVRPYIRQCVRPYVRSCVCTYIRPYIFILHLILLSFSNSGRISKKYVEWKKSMRGCKFWFQPDNKICRVETKNMSGSLIFFEPVMFLCRVKFFAKISKWNKSIWVELRAEEKIRCPPAYEKAYFKCLKPC